MFETTLPYPVFDADNHFYDAEDAITRHLEPSFVDAGKVAVDYRPDTFDRHRKKMQEEFGNEFGVPGSTRTRRIRCASRIPTSARRSCRASGCWRRRSRVARTASRSWTCRGSKRRSCSRPVWASRSRASSSTIPRRTRPTSVRTTAGCRTTGAWAYKNRIFTPANVPLANIDVMVEELERTLADGARTVLLPARTAERPVARRSVLRPVLGTHPGSARARRRAPGLHEVPARRCRVRLRPEHALLRRLRRVPVVLVLG